MAACCSCCCSCWLLSVLLLYVASLFDGAVRCYCSLLVLSAVAVCCCFVNVLVCVVARVYVCAFARSCVRVCVCSSLRVGRCW